MRWRGRGRQAAPAVSDPPGIQRGNPGRDQVRGSLREVVHNGLVFTVSGAVTTADPDQLLHAGQSRDSLLVIAGEHPGPTLRPKRHGPFKAAHPELPQGLVVPWIHLEDGNVASSAALKITAEGVVVAHDQPHERLHIIGAVEDGSGLLVAS